MTLLALLITVVPAGVAMYGRHRHGSSCEEGGEAARQATPPVRFLGTQLDIAILIFGLLFLLALVIGWLR